MDSQLQQVAWNKSEVQGQFGTPAVIDLLSAFSPIRQPGDGNCYFHSMARAFMPDSDNQSYHKVKELIKEAAQLHYQSLEVYRDPSTSLEQYLEKVGEDGYWGGALESYLLSKHLNITIITWLTDDGVSTNGAVKFGEDEVYNSVNLLLTGMGHYDYLQLKEERPAPKLSFLDKIRVVEGLIHFEEEIERQETDVNIEEAPLALVAKRINKSKINVEDYYRCCQTIPVRVGRVLDQLFGCKIGVQITNYVIKVCKDQDHGNLESLKELGHRIINEDKKIRKEFSTARLVIDKGLLDYLDAGGLIRSALPGLGLERFLTIIHDEILLDLVTVIVALLLATFLYKSDNKSKQRFIQNCVLQSGINAKRLRNALDKSKPSTLYSRPKQVISNVCETLFKKQFSKLYDSFKRMSSECLFALSCLDLNTLSLKDYMTVIYEACKEDLKSVDFSNKEVRDLKQLTETLTRIHEQGTSCLDELFDKPTRRAYRSKEDAMEFAIETYFNDRNVTKFISQTGKVVAACSISNVLSYANNLYLTKDSLGMTPEDTCQLLKEIKKLYVLQDDKDIEPIAIICDKLEANFNKLFKELPPECASECKALYDHLRNSTSGVSAWKHALRIKGIAYEGLFARQYGWDYIPEDIKPSLAMIIQTIYPSKFEDFLDRTQLHPEYRDLTPDYSLIQRTEYRDSVLPQVSNVQLYDTLGTGVEAEVRPGYREFPLPEVMVKEISSVEDVIKKFLNTSSSGSAHGMSERFFIDTSSATQAYTEQLLLVEVGYQTDVDSKVSSDQRKWKDVIGLLRMLGISCSLIVCVDKSSTDKEGWWISQDKVVLLKTSISHLFSRLIRNTPGDVTDIVVGAISTQKMRSYLKAGTVIKTPVTQKDVTETWEKMVGHISNRPTGAKLPPGVISTMELALSTGLVISKEGAETVMAGVKSNMDLITDEMERTKYAHIVNRNKVTSELLILGWLQEDIKTVRCGACLDGLTSLIKDFQTNMDKIELLTGELQYQNHKECCHSKPISVDNRSLFSRRTLDMGLVAHHPFVSYAEEACNTHLDKLVRLVLPGKTEKERKIKRAVEQLIRVCMIDSNIDVVKLPSGQLISSRLKGKQTADINRVRKVLTPSNLKVYSPVLQKTIRKALDGTNQNAGSKCSVPLSWFNSILHTLEVPLTDEDVLSKVSRSKNERKKDFRNNDRLIIRSASEVEDYLTAECEQAFNTCEGPFTLDCLLFREVYTEMLLRLSNTPYCGCPDLLAQLIKFLCRYNWYQEVVFYSKVCETFLRCVTELARPGVKLVRVRHTNINLVAKLPYNKKENVYCCLMDNKLFKLKDPFFLNRRQAVLGAAYPYILMTIYLQVYQHYRCIDELSRITEDVVKSVGIRAKTLSKSMVQELKLACLGNFEEAYNIRTKVCSDGKNYLTEESSLQFEKVSAGLSIVYGVLLKGNLLVNSQQQNKQLQTLRYGMLCGLSRLSCTKELGSKFSAPCRRIEDNIARLYLQSTIYCANRDVEQNVVHWQRQDLCPPVTIPCFSIYGMFVNSDRQFIFDIYNVHIHNKEIDNFDEAAIVVLEETAERHMQWEMHLAEALKKQGELDREVRLLLGCPNAKLSTGSLKEKASEGVKSTLSSIKMRSSFSGSGCKTFQGIADSKRKPFKLRSGLEVHYDKMQDFRQSISGPSEQYCYTPSQNSLIKDMVTIIRKNPNYTFGSYELVQAVVELGRKKISNESVEQARKDRRNWISISEVTETTSIVSMPVTDVQIKTCLSVVVGNENKKIVKLVRSKLQKLGALGPGIQLKRKDCSILLETIPGLSSSQKSTILDGLYEPVKLGFFNWSEIIKKKVEETLLTSDGNYIYCWLKTLASSVKKHLRRPLQFMKPLERDGQCFFEDSPEIDIFNQDEVAELKNLREVVVGEHCNPVRQEFLLSAWVKSVKVPKIGPIIIQEGIQSILESYPALNKIRVLFDQMQSIKKTCPTISFIKEEVEIKQLENAFILSYNSHIMKVINLVLYTCLASPWCFHYKPLESYLVRHPELFNLNLTESEVPTPLDITVSRMIITLMQEELREVKFDANAVRFLVMYLTTMFTANGKPFTLSMNEGSIQGGVNDQRLLDQTRNVFAKIGLSGQNYDFIWTIQMIANSGFNVCKKITGKLIGERLPRSVRSKVVYEMVRLVSETGVAILQQLAFTQAMDTDHRFYAVLAPKAQLGGSRDLLVQEVGTKVMHATSEMFSRTLLSTTKDDGLTNPNLKETILSKGLEALKMMRKLDGKKAGSGNLVTFYKVALISGDNTKWGPIHCCSFFSGMMQQIMMDYPDWCAYYKVTFIKNLCRQVEIPVSSLRKILNVLRGNKSDKDLEQMSEEAIRKELADSADLWDGETVKFLILSYLSKGKLALNSYNHMGQGIHHATSSVLTSLMAETFNDLCTFYFNKVFPGLQSEITHAGSSDDYAKVIIVFGTLDKTKYEEYSSTFWNHIARLKNFTSAVQRCCQMKDSSKTLVGDCFLEFYSEFMMGFRTTPAVIKFMFTGLINSSITSPQSLVQACHVSSQQATFNSVPMLTNIASAVLRQQMFYNHAEDFIRKYGYLVLGSVSSFGRLFIPKYSNLIGSNTALEDAEVIAESASSIIRSEILFDTSKITQLNILTGVDSPSSVSESSSISSLEESESKDYVFSFKVKRKFTEAETRLQELLLVGRPVETVRSIQRKSELVYTGCNESSGYNINRISSLVLHSSCSWIKQGDSTCALECWLRSRSILNVLIAGYYRQFGSEGTDRRIKLNMNRDGNYLIEDPMIQLVPEKLRLELGRLGLAKMEIKELMPPVKPSDTLSSLVAKRLIVLNAATEDYSSEVSRLKQILSSRSVLQGLAGGIKELSLPIYTIFLKSYYFQDKVFLDIQDRWSSRHSSNYRDSTGMLLTDKVVTKFSCWLDTFLNCHVGMDRVGLPQQKSLFDNSLKCVSVTKSEGGQRELSVILEHLKVLKDEFSSLVVQFSDTNRQKIKMLESVAPAAETESNKLIVTKSHLFSAVEHVKLHNNPAVVVGYLLDDSALADVRPVKVDFSSLLHDRFKVLQHYPSLTAVAEEVRKESLTLEEQGDCVDMETVSSYVSYMTLLCRLVQQSKPKLTTFYIIKSNALVNEPTVADLVSYGVKEGRSLRYRDEGFDTTTFSEKYWKIMHCITAIGSLPISNQDKTSLLISFLNWRVSLDCYRPECCLSTYDKEILTDMNGKVLINILASEAPTIKSHHEREGVVDLVDYINSPKSLLKRKPYLGTTAQFSKNGNTKNGRFTYSSSSGEAIGIFVNSKLHVHLSAESAGLLNEVERNVLNWLVNLRTETISAEQHKVFFSHLPKIHEVAQKNIDGKICGVRVDSSNPKFLRLVPPGEGIPVIKVKKGILTVKKQTVYEQGSDPHLIWGRDSLSIVFDETEVDVTYHEALLKVKEVVDKATGKDKVPQDMFRETRVTLSKIYFKSDILINSVALLHCFLEHVSSDSAAGFSGKVSFLNRVLEKTGPISELQRILTKVSKKKMKFVDKQVKEEVHMVCQNLNRAFNEERPLLSVWPEAQQYIADVGFGNIVISANQESGKSNIRWSFNTEISIEGAQSIRGLSGIISYLRSSALPRSLIPLILESRTFSTILDFNKDLHQQIDETGISLEQVDFLVCLSLYKMQEHPDCRSGLKYEHHTLLKLAEQTTFNVIKGLTLVFLPENYAISLSVSCDLINLGDACLPLASRKLAAAKKLDTCMAVLFGSSNVKPGNINDIACEINMTNNLDGTSSLAFKILPGNSGLVSLDAILSVYLKLEHSQKLFNNIFSFLAYLSGKRSTLQIESIKFKPKQLDEGKAITLEDILEVGDSVQDNDVEESTEENFDEVTFDWD